MKKILLVIASNGFQPIEYRVPKQLLTEAGFVVVTASDGVGEAIASDGSTQKVDVELPQVEAKNYDGVYFIGGPGALEHLDNQESNRILNEAMILQKPYGAICISPRILAKANVLTGRLATGWDGDGELAEIFETNNVEYVWQSVVIDGDVITGSGPEAAEEWGRAIVSFLKLDESAKFMYK